MTEQVRTVAAFDFDGTVARSDTLIPFLRRSAGSIRTARALLALSVRITRSMAGAGSRDEAKEEL
ncbi:MAG TPA: hypothetical protein VHG90_00495, partial [Acidimicrobiales bacterium]|nr:hypothetical protein [Acidimicrobiales bacterium]